MIRAAHISLGLAGLLAALPLAAMADGCVGYGEAAFAKSVREVETGIKAVMRYFPDVMTGGQDEITYDDGTKDTLYWDGFTSWFVAEITAGPVLNQTMAAHFMVDAVLAVCPSVNAGQLPDAVLDGRCIKMEAPCPAVDAKVHQ